MREHTLEAVCQYLSGRALGRYRCVKNTVLAIITALLVVNGHTTNTASVHRLSTSAALHTARPLDRVLLLERATS
jgi:hypothetical protein